MSYQPFLDQTERQAHVDLLTKAVDLAGRTLTTIQGVGVWTMLTSLLQLLTLAAVLYIAWRVS